MLTADCIQVLQSPIMNQIFRVESGGDLLAIGVVGNQLVRQPRTLPEAVATAQSLRRQGLNYSIGKGQVNQVHFARLGWEQSIARGFDECSNALAAYEIYQDCHRRAVKAGYSAHPTDAEREAPPSMKAALSCYYSGHFERGSRMGYVTKVLQQGPHARAISRASESMTGAVSMMVD